jgi:hypothetical protein
MTNLAILAAATIALGATPSVGQINDHQAKTEKLSAQSDDKKYCLQYDDLVGSRISKYECLTRKQWAKRGVDLDEHLKK